MDTYIYYYSRAARQWVVGVYRNGIRPGETLTTCNTQDLAYGIARYHAKKYGGLVQKEKIC